DVPRLHGFCLYLAISLGAGLFFFFKQKTEYEIGSGLVGWDMFIRDIIRPTSFLQFIDFARFCRLGKAFTPHPAKTTSQ
ncbi:hypothetical protein Q2405_25465, partial [Escherichia coli]|nr:hypothetical protein [Escherichia coli]